MVQLLTDTGLPVEMADRLQEAVALLDKIHTWSFKTFELPLSDFPDANPDEVDVLAGPVLGLQLMVDMLLGPEGSSRKGYRQIFGES
jgi:hypothetical protein